MSINKAIVLIFHHSSRLNWYEKISLQQCFRILHRHPIRLVCPEGTDLAEFKALVPEIIAETVPRKWMSSLERYNRMKTLPYLYRKYHHYEFMLTYELDAFVFRDELDDWCQAGYDYIGAPWMGNNGDSRVGIQTEGVGNSGFSLRNIDSALRVMNSFGVLESPIASAKRSLKRGEIVTAIAKLLFLSIVHNTHWSINRFPGHEDKFWSSVGARRDWFKIPPFETAAHFSFEREPEQLFNHCGRQLPFGCHAWQKYDLEFWRPHIEAQGYSITADEKRARNPPQ